MVNEIKFKTVLSNLTKGGKACYFAIPLNNGTEYLKERYKEIGTLINMSAPFAQTASNICLDKMVELALSGARIETENISMYVTAKGGFASTSDKWDPDRNSLHLVVNLKGELKKALENIKFVNTTEGIVARITYASDDVARVNGQISGLTTATIELAGEGLNLDTSSDDQGVWFCDAEKTIVSKLVVTARTEQTLDCHPSTELAQGDGYLMVATNNSEAGKGIAVVYHAVEVVRAAE